MNKKIKRAKKASTSAQTPVSAPEPPPESTSGVPTPMAPDAGSVKLPSSVKISCPICQTHWANASIEFGKPILRGQFAPREDLKAQVKFQANGLPICPVCNFKYDDRSMYSLLIAAVNEGELERKAWNRP